MHICTIGSVCFSPCALSEALGCVAQRILNGGMGGGGLKQPTHRQPEEGHLFNRSRNASRQRQHAHPIRPPSKSSQAISPFPPPASPRPAHAPSYKHVRLSPCTEDTATGMMSRGGIAISSPRARTKRQTDPRRCEPGIAFRRRERLDRSSRVRY
ncbi:hypothetical protein BJ875DRAFT_81012 [Amylocarpus encephaloides]|uniref:Uncharacterized protein n=1 Tax=Amylocarpus encephaloides TaxID=45428 RepID=A0A9P8C4V7_9HELO|nr:hypothetical protein BJ875DRAFT_81012 [Amylocarpus encephaloides]